MDNRKHRRRTHRRSYRRNPEFVNQLIATLKTAAPIVAGFFAHRALTNLVDDQLAKVDAFNTGALKDYRGLISGILVAAAGGPLAAMVVPGQARSIGIGMGTSLLHGFAITLLNKFGQPDVAGYLSAYPDADGGAYSEYMEMNGYGGYGQFTQAAAGYGAPQFTQAAAGYGYPQITQAAAGLTGFNEYMATGEYELTGGVGDTETIDEGIYPNTTSAEYALSVAEAAAGVGDIGFQSTVDPTMYAQAISDGPTGARAGILEGGDGIFS